MQCLPLLGVAGVESHVGTAACITLLGCFEKSEHVFQGLPKPVVLAHSASGGSTVTELPKVSVFDEAARVEGVVVGYVEEGLLMAAGAFMLVATWLEDL